MIKEDVSQDLIPSRIRMSIMGVEKIFDLLVSHFKTQVIQEIVIE